MDEVTRHRAALVARIVDGPAHSSTTHRHAAFDNADVPASMRPLLDKVARSAWKVTSADVGAVKSAGLADDEVFELVVCAAVGQATRQIETARQLLADVVAERVGGTK